MTVAVVVQLPPPITATADGALPAVLSSARTVADSGRLVVVGPPGAGPGAPRPVVRAADTLLDGLRLAVDDAPAVGVVLVHHVAGGPIAVSTAAALIAAVDAGAAVAAPMVPMSDTVKRVVGDRVVQTVDRDGLRTAEPPYAAAVATVRSRLAATIDPVEGVDTMAGLLWWLAGPGSVVEVPGALDRATGAPPATMRPRPTVRP